MKWNTNNYSRHAGFVPDFGIELIKAFSLKPGEHVLDIGCGDGTLSRELEKNGCSVLGIDSSRDMIESAKLKGIKAMVTDAQDMSFHQQFDVVFSNAALHWMKNADSVIQNVYDALKPNGRFCAEFGAQKNIHAIVTEVYKELNQYGLDGDKYNLWYFPSEQEYKAKLTEGGFDVVAFSVFERPTQLPTNITGWLHTFALPFLKDIPENQHNQFIESVSKNLADKLQVKDKGWYADYVRCRFVAKKKSPEAAG